MVLQPALGNYAGGDRFWDREREVEEIRSYLASGQGVLLTGPRRVGKTSVVHAVLDGLPEPMLGLFLDVEQCAGPTEMFAGLAARASADAGTWSRVRRWFGSRLKDTADRLEKVELGVLKVELQAAMAGSWREDARGVVQALSGNERATVVAVDELPLLVDRVLKRDADEAELFLSTLRALAEELPAVRWLVSGSIGLEPVLHRAGLTGLITHLRAYPIDAWDEAATVGAIDALAQATELALEPGAAAAAHDRLGLGVPYHVQLLMDEIRRDADRRGNRRVTAGDVSRIYDGPFLTSAVRAHLLHLETRLRTVLGEGDALRLARDVLTQAAVADVVRLADAEALADDVLEDGGEERAATLREVLEILVHDAYIERAPDGWRFRSRLVRDWWRQSNELGFVRADRRRPPRQP